MSDPTSGTLPSLESSTPGNDGATVVLIAYIFLVFTVLTIIGRISANVTRKRGLEQEDGIMILATAFAIAQSVITERAVDSGLGRHMDKLNAGQISSYYKLMYTGQILSIFPMTFAKLAVVWLVKRIPGDRSMQLPCLIASIGILTWTVFSLLAFLFECGAHLPWVYTPQKCAGGIWYAVVTLNILSDAVLSFFFAPTLWKLQTSRPQRLKVIILFAVRILVCAAAIVQLAFLPAALNNQDQTRSRVNATIANQLVMNLSVITAAVPSLYRSVADLRSGMGLHIPESHLEMYNSGSKSRGQTNVKTLKSASKAFSRDRSNNRSQLGRDEKTIAVSESEEHFGPGAEDSKNNTKIEHDPGFNNAETGSRASDGSEQMIIRHTTAWDVRYEEN